MHPAPELQTARVKRNRGEQKVGRQWPYQKKREAPRDDPTSQHNVADPEREYFVHEPLSLDKASIRLLEVLPLDKTGAVRCRIRHAVLGAPVSVNDPSEVPASLIYTCLSYVWGTDYKMHHILMNGKRFEIRDNLWRFLRLVSSMTKQNLRDGNGEPYTLEVGEWWQSLWIDALCIDQQSIVERNHQVQQMGRIYSDAIRVVSWLGVDPYLEALFRSTQRMSSRHEMHLYEGLQLVSQLSTNEYWKRAWVTQELLSARELFLMAGDIITPSDKLELVKDRLDDTRSRTELDEILLYLRTRLHTLGTSRRLVHNLEVFQNKVCADIRDRVYSLVSVSSDGHQIHVDYQCSWVELMLKVLHLSADTFCPRTALVVFHALRVHHRSSTRWRVTRRLPFPLRIGETLVITVHNTQQLAHVSPCARCGCDERSSLTRPKGRGVIDVYFCLYCKHSERSTPKETHQAFHTEHLRLVWGIVGAVNECGWHLFWAPEICWPWYRLNGHIDVRTNSEGAFEAFNLSVGVLNEISDWLSKETPSRSHDDQYYERPAQAWENPDPYIGDKENMTSRWHMTSERYYLLH